jgi:hypothetical protein
LRELLRAGGRMALSDANRFTAAELLAIAALRGGFIGVRLDFPRCA